ncbi:MAG: ABC transporter permease subunit [Phycisphaerae bacterium]
MPSVLKDLGLWFWRLVPANPILVRVVSGGGKRMQHLLIRVGYLAVLAVAVIIGVLVTQTGGSSLAELAKEATNVFKYLSIIQLAMVCVIAPVFAAAAITQEKDSQTYNILLSTPLTNGQIVLGSLLSRLFFVFALLLAGIPLFCVMMVYGGITGDKIALAITLAGATALLTGTLAITISVIKIGTGRTIFSFYLAIAIYLIVIYLLSFWPGTIPAEAAPAPGQSARMSWLAAFHPFLSLGVALGETPAPEIGVVLHRGFPSAWLLAYPHYSYIAMTVLISTLLILVSLFFVRRSAKEGEATLLSRIFRRDLVGAGGHPGSEEDSRTRKPRRVSRNPITWRESVTSAAAGGGAVGRYLLISVGMIVALALLIFYATGSLTTAETRVWLFGVVVAELMIALFVATTTAATSMTREKESNTMELLLATPMTSKTIITGKIWGLVHAAGPMLLLPYTAIALFLFWDLVTGKLFGAKANPVVNVEALITLPILLIAFTSFACMIGLMYSINSKKTIAAVFTSMAIVILVFGLTGGCASIVRTSASGGIMTAAFMPLTPFTACYMVIDPALAASRDGITPLAGSGLGACRIVAGIAALCAAGVYFLIGIQLRSHMVRNFDMIIRKQTA